LTKRRYKTRTSLVALAPAVFESLMPVQLASQAYFESLPGVPKCGNNQNPATYMLEVIGAGIGHDALRDFALDYKNRRGSQIPFSNCGNRLMAS
jgi:hypothetical protein